MEVFLRNPPDTCGSCGGVVVRGIHALGLGRCRLEICLEGDKTSLLVELGHCFPAIRHLHPAIAVRLVAELEGEPRTPFLSAAAEAARTLAGTRRLIPAVGTLQLKELDHLLETQRIPSL